VFALSAVLASLTPPSRAADIAAFFPPVNRPVSELALGAQEGEAHNRVPYRASYNEWKWSLAAVAASQALDGASSWGLRELNPILTDGSERFGMRAATVKFGAAGAILGLECFLVKKHPGAARIVSKLNWSSAVVTGAFAAHNFAIK
jgi:hypothetical protein